MKTILKSLAAIVAVGAVAGGATFAYFSDTDKIAGNKVTAGTLDLVVGESSSLPVVFENAYPGQEASKTFTLKNAGTIQGHLVLDLDKPSIVDKENSCTEPERTDEDDCISEGYANGSGELCGKLDVRLVQLMGTDVADYLIFDSTVDGYGIDISTGELEFKNANVNLAGGDSATFRLTTTVDKNADNRIQSDTCGADFLVGLLQDVNGDGRADKDE